MEKFLKSVSEYETRQTEALRQLNKNDNNTIDFINRLLRIGSD